MPDMSPKWLAKVQARVDAYEEYDINGYGSGRPVIIEFLTEVERLQLLESDRSEWMEVAAKNLERAENAEARVAEIKKELFHLDLTLAGVMHFSDKWLSDYLAEGGPKGEPENRAAKSRRIALEAIEKAEAERDKLHEAAIQAIELMASYGADALNGGGKNMVRILHAALLTGGDGKK